MNKQSIYFLVIITLVALASSGCNRNEEARPRNSSGDNDSWLIEKDEVIHWDSEKDKIQSIDTNEFVAITRSTLQDDDMVFAVHHNGVTKVFPMTVMGGHEIANDSINDHYFALTYCPITGSALSWNRKINGQVNQFGVSGKLYNNNLVPYDRKTGSHWSQMVSLCVNGDLIGQEPVTEMVLETSYSTIKLADPNALVLSHHHCEGGVCLRLKSSNDFGDDGDDNDVTELLPDTRYFGIVKDRTAQLFALDNFAKGTAIFQTRFKGKSIIIAGSSSLNFYVAFNYLQDSPDQKIFAVQDEFPVIMEDSKNNRYDVFGNIVSGPDSGKRLTSPTSYLANTFAWVDLFSEVSLYKD